MMIHFSHDYEQGIKDERDRLLALLREKKALRDSLFNDDLVLYTEDGAIDITQNELDGNDE